MSWPAQSLNMTVEEYLEFEEHSDARHEYIDGQVYAMVGSSEAHNVITLNLATILRNHLRGSGCRAYMADMKLRIEATNAFYYPDVMVTCEPFKANSLFNRSPVLIAEVLSASTQEIDRREKLVAYKQLATLAEYLVISQDHRRVELYRKVSTGKWELHVFRDSEEINLHALPTGPFVLKLDELYDEVEF